MKPEINHNDVHPPKESKELPKTNERLLLPEPKKYPALPPARAEDDKKTEALSENGNTQKANERLLLPEGSKYQALPPGSKEGSEKREATPNKETKDSLSQNQGTLIPTASKEKIGAVSDQGSTPKKYELNLPDKTATNDVSNQGNKPKSFKLDLFNEGNNENVPATSEKTGDKASLDSKSAIPVSEANEQNEQGQNKKDAENNNGNNENDNVQTSEGGGIPEADTQKSNNQTDFKPGLWDRFVDAVGPGLVTLATATGFFNPELYNIFDPIDLDAEPQVIAEQIEDWNNMLDPLDDLKDMVEAYNKMMGVGEETPEGLALPSETAISGEPPDWIGEIKELQNRFANDPELQEAFAGLIDSLEALKKDGIDPKYSFDLWKLLNELNQSNE